MQRCSELCPDDQLDMELNICTFMNNTFCINHLKQYLFQTNMYFIPSDLELFIDALYEYKEMLGYNSQLYFIIRKIRKETILHIHTLYTKDKQYIEEYTLNDEDALKFMNASNAIKRTTLKYEDNFQKEYYEYPLKVLLLTKDNKLKTLDLSQTNLIYLYKLYRVKTNANDTGRESISVVRKNIGHALFYIDFSFDRTLNNIPIMGHVVSKSIIYIVIDDNKVDFISTKRPSLEYYIKHVDTYEDIAKYTLKYINNNFDLIADKLNLTKYIVSDTYDITFD